MNELLVFAKYPVAGRVKTRLAKRVGMEQATAIYRDMVETVWRQTEASSDRYYRVLCFDPPEREMDFVNWLKVTNLRPQHGVGLGERLMLAISESLTRANRAIVIGSDCVELDAALICTGFEALEHHDLVLGPAKDGGYYLIGCKQLHRELFVDMPWSTPQVLRDTQAQARRLQLKTYLLPVRSDLDL